MDDDDERIEKQRLMEQKRQKFYDDVDNEEFF
jgi:hypothetical protein